MEVTDPLQPNTTLGGCRSGTPDGAVILCSPGSRGPGTHLSANRAGESGLVDSRSCMAFHSLMQLCSEPTQLS